MRSRLALLWPLGVLLPLVAAYGQDSLDPAAGKANGSAEQALLEELPVVQAAALHQQTLQEAPANVTVITASDIRKYGYRTLGEALASVRGFYGTYDRTYHYIGVSGISTPGDFNTRFLVMINGHNMTEHVYDSNGFFGQDFGLDMDLVERIEIIRGSASALYGSNAMLATINVVTRSPVDVPGIRVSSETASFGERKVLFSDSVYLGRGANLLLSASGFDNGGQTIYVPAFDIPPAQNGLIHDQDGEQGYHTFANLLWGNWNITAYFNSRRKDVPVNAADDTVFNDRGSHVRDGHNFVEAAHSSDIGARGTLRYRFYYDDYRYDDRFDYWLGAAGSQYIQDERSLSRNEWAGSEVTWTTPFLKRADVVVGAEGDWEFRNLQQEQAVSPSRYSIVNFNVPDHRLALFSQQQWKLGTRWTVYTGLRFDASHNYGKALSPRLALVYQRSPSTVYKLVYGRPFRNPSAFEKYFSDNQTLVANPALHAERANTFELSGEHKFSPILTGIVNVYQYRIQGLIDLNETAEQQVPQYQNLDRIRSSGVELEISAKLHGGFELLGSAALQRVVDLDTNLGLANSPRGLYKLRAGLPLVHQRLFASSAISYDSAVSTDAGVKLPPVFLQDFTLGMRPVSGFSVQLGVRNTWNRSYSDPVGLAVDTIIQDGRSIYLKVTWRDHAAT